MSDENKQHQGEAINLAAVATLVDDGDGGLEASWLLEGGTAELFAGMTLLVADNDQDLCAKDGSAQVYTHADPGEVERLRIALGNTQVLLDQANYHKAQRGETIDTLRAQLAERDALLRIYESFPGYLIDHCEGNTIYEESLQHWLAEHIKSLPASAEPSEPVEKE